MINDLKRKKYRQYQILEFAASVPNPMLPGTTLLPIFRIENISPGVWLVLKLV